MSLFFYTNFVIILSIIPKVSREIVNVIISWKCTIIIIKKTLDVNGRKENRKSEKKKILAWLSSIQEATWISWDFFLSCRHCYLPFYLHDKWKWILSPVTGGEMKRDQKEKKIDKHRHYGVRKGQKQLEFIVPAGETLSPCFLLRHGVRYFHQQNQHLALQNTCLRWGISV